MGSVGFRVSDEVKVRMEEYDEVNWSAVLRDHVKKELQRLESRNIGHTVATSERLSGAIDAGEAATTNTAERIREFRDARYSEERPRWPTRLSTPALSSSGTFPSNITNRPEHFVTISSTAMSIARTSGRSPRPPTVTTSSYNSARTSVCVPLILLAVRL
jgi:hypothetical protein